MIVARTIPEVRQAVAAARADGRRVGLVPTMGALHEGHLSLVRAATEGCDFVVVSIFVNPTQFAPGEDLDTYPRPVEADLSACRQEGADMVFLPEVTTLYGDGAATTVTVSGVTEALCGRSRPAHFAGVTTICAKLFNIVGADAAYVGAKDFQQSVVIARMVEDLDIPIEIVRCPIVREADGLAMSSRNAFLTAEERSQAAAIHKALATAEGMIRRDQPRATDVVTAVADHLAAADGGRLLLFGPAAG